MNTIFCVADILHNLARSFLKNTADVDIKRLFNFYNTAINFKDNIKNLNDRCGIYCLNNYFRDACDKAVTLSKYKIYLMIVEKESSFTSKYNDSIYKYIGWVEDEEGQYLFGGLD